MLHGEEWLPSSHSSREPVTPLKFNQRCSQSHLESSVVFTDTKEMPTFCMESIQRSSPTKVNLCKRHIPIDPKCEACRTSLEDVLHAVWTCSLIQLAWEKEIWTHKLRSSQVLDYADLFSKVLESGSQQNFEAFITISWVLWNI